MAVVKAKEIKSKKKINPKREMYATICFYYPKYSLKQVEKMAYRDVKLLYKKAMQIEATKMYNLLQIVAAPHTKKGVGIKKLSDYYKKMMENGS